MSRIAHGIMDEWCKRSSALRQRYRRGECFVGGWHSEGVNWKGCGDACVAAALGRLRFFRHKENALNSMAKGKRSVASCRLGLCELGRFWQVI